MFSWFRRRSFGVLVLCSANICRSPVAEAMLRHHLRLRGLRRRVRVRSAGTAVGMPGALPDPRMVALAASAGISLRGIRARPVTASAVAASDCIWVMGREHAEAVIEQFPDAEARVALFDPSGETVADPFFSDRAGIERIFERLQEIASARAVQLEERLLTPPEGGSAAAGRDRDYPGRKNSSGSG